MKALLNVILLIFIHLVPSQLQQKETYQSLMLPFKGLAPSALKKTHAKESNQCLKATAFNPIFFEKKI